MAGLSKNAIIAIVAVIVVVGASASALVLLNNGNKEPAKALLSGADLKVLGNADGDGDIDDNDVNEINKIIEKSGTVEEYPLADANNDKVIDSKDVDFVKAILNHKSGDAQVPVWHVNFHDSNSDGAMNMEMVQTMYPLTSVIVTGSANVLMMMQ